MSAGKGKAASPAKAPKAGPGRPVSPGPPRNEAQVRMAAAVESAELEREAADLAYGEAASVANELALLSAEMRLSTAWSAYCRAQNIHTTAIKYAEDRTKFAGRIAALRELVATDQLGELMAIKERESAAGRMV